MRVWEYLKHYFIPGEHNAYRPRILHRPWLVFFLAVILLTEGFLVSNLIARQSDQQFLAAVVPAEIIALTNTQRADNSVGQLSEDALLDSAAQAKANDMAAKEYFSHVGPDGKTPWQWIDESGYQYQYAGENLAVRFIDSADVVNAWMASPTHRANIVKPVYTQIGVGVAQGLYEGQPATYVVQYFGTPKTAAAAAVADTEAEAATPAPPATTPAAPAVAIASTTATTTPVAAAAATPAPQVEGAATEAAPSQLENVVAQNVTPPANPGASFTQSFVRQLVRAFSEPQQTSNLVLGLVATLLLIALFFTFFVHLHIQHPTMLATGAFVAALALFFVVLNVHLVGGVGDSLQSASVIQSQGGVVISQEAADTGYALFPQQ